jgi:hypothetical protein
LLDNAPLWLVFSFSVSLVLLSIVVGFAIGLRQRARGTDIAEGPVGSIIGALLGLLAFLLTFTFGMASSRFDARRQLLLSEVNAIATTALRAETLPEPERSACLSLFRKYVDIRVEVAGNPFRIKRALAESDSLQDDLWANAVSISGKMNSPIGALFVSSLNEVIDLHTSRKTVVLLYRIPLTIWLGLGMVTVFSMGAVGFQFGLFAKHHWGLGLVLAMTFSTVVLLITVLDRPYDDLLKVNHGAMLELQQKLHRPNP